MNWLRKSLVGAALLLVPLAALSAGCHDHHDGCCEGRSIRAYHGGKYERPVRYSRGHRVQYERYRHCD